MKRSHLVDARRMATWTGAALALFVGSIGSAQAAVPQGLAPAAGQWIQHAGRFTQNAGQWAPEARFHVGAGERQLWVVDHGFVIETRRRQEGAGRGCAVGFEVEGASGCAAIGEQELELATRFVSADGSARRAASFERVRLADLRPGVDLVLRFSEGRFEYDLELDPGVELAEVVVRVEGAEGLSLEADGRLRIDTELGVLHQSPPVSWTLNELGLRRSVASRFELRGDARYAFVVDERARDEALVVDPGVVFGSYIGGTGQDVAQAVAVGQNGEIVAAGLTASYDFPATRRTYDLQLDGQSDGFILRASPDGHTLRSATYFGGSSSENVTALAIGPAGEIGVTGETRSADFPVTAGAFDATYNGGADVFVAIFSPDGASLLHSTFFGHAGDERALGLALGAGLEATLCGATNSVSFPVSLGAIDSTFNGGVFGGGDAFVARIGPNLGSLGFSTFLGGSNNETALGLALGANGETTVVGVTGSSTFPTTAGSFDPTLNGTGTTGDGFVARVNSMGSALLWSTFLGGSEEDEVRAVSLFPDGSVGLAGTTWSSDLPISAGASQTSSGGSGDAFVAGLSSNGAALTHATYLGGNDLDRGTGVAAEAGGTLAVCGATRSVDFPSSPWAYDAVFNSAIDAFESDAFVARVAADGAHEYVSYVGGAQDDEALGLALDADGSVLVCGYTNSGSFPTPGGFDPYYDFSMVPDGFVLRFEMLRYPFAYGSGKPNSMGWTPVMGGGFASHASGSHTIYMDLGVPGEPAFLFRGTGAAQIPFQGGNLWVAPPFVRVAGMQTDFFGAASATITIDPAMVGTTSWYQFWYADPGDLFGVGLTQGFEVRYYP